MSMGSWGSIVFKVSSRTVMVPKDITRKTGSNWATHNLISGKPKSQYQGAELRSVSLSVVLRADYGVRPRQQLERLANMAELPYAHPLIIGGKQLAKNPFRLVSVSETWNTVYNGGELFSAEVALTFEEYV